MFHIRFIAANKSLINVGSLSLRNTVGNIAKFNNTFSDNALPTVVAFSSGIGISQHHFEKQQIAVRM